jgi:hypothetical protein
MGRWVFAFLILVLMGAQVAPAQEIEYVGSTFWSLANDVEVAGPYAYCAYANGLLILEISNPDSPIYVSKEFCPGEGRKIFISGNYAYLADRQAGLQIIDISDVQNPQTVGQYQAPWRVNDVFIRGGYAYIIGDYISRGLQIIDVSSPANPVFVGGDTIPDYGRTSAISLSGDYAYVGMYSPSHLHVFDVSNPAQPSLVGGLNIPGGSGSSINGLAIRDEYLFATSNEGLYVIDISDPDSLEQVGRNRQDALKDIRIEGNYAYMTGNHDIFVYDLSDPLRPTRLDFLGHPSWSTVQGLDVAGGSAYITYEMGVMVIDVSNPDSLELRGSYKPPSFTHANIDLAVSSGFAYIPRGYSLHIANILNPADPAFADSLEMPDQMSRIFISGTYAYLIGSFGNLWMVDISVPGAPSLVGNYMCQAATLNSIFVSGSYAYLSTGLGLEIVDIREPANAILVGQYWRLGDICVAGNYAYMTVTGQSYEFHVIDVSNPANPTLAGSLDLEGSGARTPLVAGNYVIVRRSPGINSIDVSNPMSPRIAGACSTRVNSHSTDMSVSDNFAYMSNLGPSGMEGGIDIFDISDPENITLAARPAVTGYVYNIHIHNDYSYLSTECSMLIMTTLRTGIEDGPPMPSAFSLSQNYPNPFNAATTIRFSLARRGPVRLEVYNLLGQKVAGLVRCDLQAGEHNVAWDAGGLSSGVYLARLAAMGESETIKMVVLK